MDITRRMFLFGRKGLADDSGSSLIEYGLITSLIAVACITSLRALGFSIKEKLRCTARAIAGKKIGKKCKKAGF